MESAHCFLMTVAQFTDALSSVRLLYLRFLLFIYLLLGWFCFLAFFWWVSLLFWYWFFLLFSCHSPDLYFLYKVLRATCLTIISISDQKCSIYNVMYLNFGLSSTLSLVLRRATGFSLSTFLLRSNFLVKVSVKSNIRKWNMSQIQNNSGVTSLTPW